MIKLQTRKIFNEANSESLDNYDLIFNWLQSLRTYKV